MTNKGTKQVIHTRRSKKGKLFRAGRGLSALMSKIKTKAIAIKKDVAHRIEYSGIEYEYEELVDRIGERYEKLKLREGKERILSFDKKMELLHKAYNDHMLKYPKKKKYMDFKRLLSYFPEPFSKVYPVEYKKMMAKAEGSEVDLYKAIAEG